jgi:hypothetical protein
MEGSGMSITIERYRAPGGMGAHMPGATTSAYRVTDTRGPGDVNFRMHRLWRADNRYSGIVCVRRHESGGLELSFDALRHGAKPRPPVVVAEDQVRAFVLSCLECCRPDDVEAPDVEGRG